MALSGAMLAALARTVGVSAMYGLLSSEYDHLFATVSRPLDRMATSELKMHRAARMVVLCMHT